MSQTRPIQLLNAMVVGKKLLPNSFGNAVEAIIHQTGNCSAKQVVQPFAWMLFVRLDTAGATSQSDSQQDVSSGNASQSPIIQYVFGAN